MVLGEQLVELKQEFISKEAYLGFWCSVESLLKAKPEMRNEFAEFLGVLQSTQGSEVAYLQMYIHNFLNYHNVYKLNEVASQRYAFDETGSLCKSFISVKRLEELYDDGMGLPHSIFNERFVNLDDIENLRPHEILENIENGLRGNYLTRLVSGEAFPASKISNGLYLYFVSNSTNEFNLSENNDIIIEFQFNDLNYANISGRFEVDRQGCRRFVISEMQTGHDINKGDSEGRERFSTFQRRWNAEKGTQLPAFLAATSLYIEQLIKSGYLREDDEVEISSLHRNAYGSGRFLLRRNEMIVREYESNLFTEQKKEISDAQLKESGVPIFDCNNSNVIESVIALAKKQYTVGLEKTDFDFIATLDGLTGNKFLPLLNRLAIPVQRLNSDANFERALSELVRTTSAFKATFRNYPQHDEAGKVGGYKKFRDMVSSGAAIYDPKIGLVTSAKNLASLSSNSQLQPFRRISFDPKPDLSLLKVDRIKAVASYFNKVGGNMDKTWDMRYPHLRIYKGLIHSINQARFYRTTHPLVAGSIRRMEELSELNVYKPNEVPSISTYATEALTAQFADLSAGSIVLLDELIREVNSNPNPDWGEYGVLTKKNAMSVIKTAQCIGFSSKYNVVNFSPYDEEIPCLVQLPQDIELRKEVLAKYINEINSDSVPLRMIDLVHRPRNCAVCPIDHCGTVDMRLNDQIKVAIRNYYKIAEFAAAERVLGGLQSPNIYEP